MPYRRLPNTNKARLRALQAAIEKGRSLPFNTIPFSVNLLSEAERLCREFERSMLYYGQCLANQAKANKKHQENVRRARLYVSHFIQVLNLSVIREEIKTSAKRLYGLQENTHTLPDLSTESLLKEWGNRIIEGEEKRMLEGGTPIYTPTIAKVKVLFDIFEESYQVQKNFQRITQRSSQRLVEQIPKVDAVILQLWDAIEDKYKNLDQKERLDVCRKFGVVYYYRKKKNVNVD
ncbi:MAG: hypothetical protein GX905_04025 [Bacteroidales bacterium]|nr:hypothetical protein [Bacteroidales bacterium]